MNHKIYIILWAVSVLHLHGCTTKTTGVVEYFDRSSFPVSDSLQGEVVDFNGALVPFYYYILKDTLLLVDNGNHHPDHFIELYGLNSKRHIVDICPKGKGPGEFLSTKVEYRNNNDFFTVFDVVTRKVAEYDIEKVLQQGKAYHPPQITLPSITNSIARLDSGHWVGFNLWYWDEQNRNATFNLFLTAADGKLIAPYDRPRDYRYFPANVTGAHISVSPTRDRIVLPYLRDDKVEIYDKQLLLIKTLRGPDRFKIEYRTREDGSHVSFAVNKYYRAYSSCYYTDHHIYMIYLGLNGVSRKENLEPPVEVFKIDWEGNLLARYQLDRYIYSITVDSSETYLYGTYHNDFDDYPQLIRYRLK